VCNEPVIMSMTILLIRPIILTMGSNFDPISMKLTESVYLIGGAAYGLSAAGDCNVYLIDCGGEYAMIDAGGGSGVKAILENVKRDGLELKNIKITFLTHCHFDHIGGASELKDLTGCKLLAHKNEVYSITNLDENVLMEMARFRGINFKAPTLDEMLEDNDCVNLGNITLKVLHTPGHTQGCISIFIIEEDGKKAIFTGDIASTTGRLGFINGPGFDLNAWKNSVKRLILEAPDRIYPGHNTFMLSGATEDLKLTDQKMNAPWTTIVTSVG
jgi:glyoxylase-like metal-dependent hydrolase (beta-lactamase superfamily II)